MRLLPIPIKVFMMARVLLALVNTSSLVLIFIAGYFALNLIRLSGQQVDDVFIDTSELMDIVILIVSIGSFVGVSGATLAAVNWKRLHVIEKGITVSIFPLLAIIFLGTASAQP